MKLKDFLFCEDVRNELHGKLSLMGLYNDHIIIRPFVNQTIQWPIPLSLAMVLRFQITPKDERPDNFELEFLMNNKLIAKIPGSVNNVPKEQLNFSITLKGQGIPIELGSIGFKIKLLNRNKVLLSSSHEDALKIFEGEQLPDVKI